MTYTDGVFGTRSVERHDPRCPVTELHLARRHSVYGRILRAARAALSRTASERCAPPPPPPPPPRIAIEPAQTLAAGLGRLGYGIDDVRTAGERNGIREHPTRNPCHRRAVRAPARCPTWTNSTRWEQIRTAIAAA
jgi:hypothetical protein